MAHFKRKKTKRRVRCTICTAYRWLGNSKRRWKEKDKSKLRNNDLLLIDAT